jgi:hypothetical protein
MELHIDSQVVVKIIQEDGTDIHLIIFLSSVVG